jgi:anaerobic magnesium-protoporphyrin IX monomethyl ester cyclase
MIKKIVLINPNYQENTESIAQVSRGPPLGLAYIASQLEKENYAVEVIDANAENTDEDGILAAIAGADLVGLTAVTPTLHLCARLSGKIKAGYPKVITVLGGVHPTMLGFEALTPEFDYIIKGEAEYTLPALVYRINHRKDISKIPGLVFRKGKKIIETRRAKEALLDKMAFPARYKLEKGRYYSVDSGNFTTILSTRGCSRSCSYCGVPKLFGNRIRPRSPSNVVAEIKQCVDMQGITDFGFLDDTFTFDKKWVKELCAEITNKSLQKRIRWTCLTRVDCVDEALLESMRYAGCIRVEFGIESGSEEVLHYLNKEITLAQIKNAFGIARKVGLLTMGFIIINAPVETKEMLRKTKKLVLDINPDYLQISYLTPYPGTKLFGTCSNENLIKECSWPDYVFLRKPIIKNKNYTENYLKGFKRSIEFQLYFNPRYAMPRLMRILKFNPGFSTLFSSTGKLIRNFIKGDMLNQKNAAQ